MDERYAYISTEMEGYLGNILVIYDCVIRSARPRFRAGGCRASMSPARDTDLAGNGLPSASHIAPGDQLWRVAGKRACA